MSVTCDTTVGGLNNDKYCGKCKDDVGGYCEKYKDFMNHDKHGYIKCEACRPKPPCEVKK
jgi:hypothetical protein